MLPPLPPEVLETFLRRLPSVRGQVPRYLEAQGLYDPRLEAQGLYDPNVRLNQLVQLTTKLVQLTTKMVEGMQKVPQGIVCTMEKTITGNRVTRIRLKEEPEADHQPWFSATITNDEDSESDVWVAVNDPTKRFRKLRPSESVKVDFHAPKLEDIYAKCAAADESATLVIQGDY